MRKSSDTKQSSPGRKCLKKFLFYFKEGYSDPQFLAWERDYKWTAHETFQELLNKKAYNKLLIDKEYKHIAETAVRIESKTNLLFSFEKMALRDAIKSIEGAEIFSIGLFDYVYGTGTLEKRFEKFCEVVSLLPRKQTRVLTWPLLTVFGFIANPLEQIFLKPRVTKEAARKYQFDFIYNPKPNWVTYQSLFSFAEQIRLDTRKYKPKDYIDLQSFIWVMGSEEYPD